MMVPMMTSGGLFHTLQCPWRCNAACSTHAYLPPATCMTGPMHPTPRRFNCQSSSMLFLASMGFDFNKWLKEGVTFAPLAWRDKRVAEVVREERRRQVGRAVEGARVSGIWAERDLGKWAKQMGGKRAA